MGSTLSIERDPTEARSQVLLLTAEEAARILSVSRSRVYELIAAGELASLKLGRSRRISRRALETFIEEREAAGNDAA